MGFFLAFSIQISPQSSLGFFARLLSGLAEGALASSPLRSLDPKANPLLATSDTASEKSQLGPPHNTTKKLGRKEVIT